MRKGWEIKKLGDVCELYQPKTISSKEMLKDGKYPVFGANGIIGKFDKYNHEKPQLLITCRGATCGSVNISLPKSWINGNAMVVRPVDKTLDLKFVEYLFRGGIDISKIITGAAQPQITRQNLSPILIAYPKSIKEQQEIVSIIDDAFESIDRAISNAEQNLKNSKELFETYFHEVLENGKNIWEEKKLDEVCDFRNGAAHEQCIDENGKYLLVNSKFISSDGKKFKRTNSALSPLFSNDIAFVMSDVPNGKALAKCFLIDKDDTYTLNQRIGLIKSKVFVPEFLVYQFNRNKYLLSFNNGENQTNLRKSDILNCPLWLPTKSEQHVIVRQLDDMQAETQKLKILYQKKLNDLEELKKSILQKAFNGELKTSKISV